jgi:hypothetical protein
VATLDGHAAASLAILRSGATSLTLSAAKSAAPRLGVDWSIGDDIGYDLTHPSLPHGHICGVARAVAWEATVSGVETVSPILATAEVGV